MESIYQDRLGTDVRKVWEKLAVLNTFCDHCGLELGLVFQSGAAPKEVALDLVHAADDDIY